MRGFTKEPNVNPSAYYLVQVMSKPWGHKTVMRYYRGRENFKPNTFNLLRYEETA